MHGSAMFLMILGFAHVMGCGQPAETGLVQLHGEPALATPTESAPAEFDPGILLETDAIALAWQADYRPIALMFSEDGSKLLHGRIDLRRGH